MNFSHNTLLSKLDPSRERTFFAHLSPFCAKIHVVVQEQGQPVESVYFPSSGMISLVTVMRDGTMIETAGVGFDNAVGIGTALSGRTSSSRGVVQLPLISLRISKANFNRAFAESAAIRAMVHEANELMLEQVQQSAACNALHDIETRLARWLLRCSDYAGATKLRLTQEFIAQMLGVRRPTVTNIACSLQQRGFIDYTRGQIIVLDRQSLAKLACECYAAPADERPAIAVRPAPLLGGAPFAPQRQE